MPIPDINTHITDQSIYPDKVEVSMSYGVSGMGSWIDFLGRMTRGGWTRVPGKRLLRTSLPQEASYNPHENFLTFIVTLNALSDFHLRRNDYDEVGNPAESTNWLHQTTNMNNIRAHLCHHLGDRIGATALDIPCLEVFEDVTLYLRSVKLHAIELCVDIATDRGEFLIKRVTPRFLQRFNHVEQRFMGPLEERWKLAATSPKSAVMELLASGARYTARQTGGSELKSLWRKRLYGDCYRCEA
jgi:hypothetical protein